MNARLEKDSLHNKPQRLIDDNFKICIVTHVHSRLS